MQETRKIFAAPDMRITATCVRLVDDLVNNYYPMPRDATDGDEILVGRIRRDAAILKAARSTCSSRATSCAKVRR